MRTVPKIWNRQLLGITELHLVPYHYVESLQFKVLEINIKILKGMCFDEIG